MIAYITGDTSQLEFAKNLAETVLSLPAAIPFYTNMARAALALQAVQQVDAASAREQYAVLKFVPGIMLLYVNTDRILGLLANTMGNSDAEVAHFEDALTFCRKAGYRPELAWTCFDYGDALLQRNEPGHRGKSMSLLDESLAISTELGMRTLLERVIALKGRAESQPVKPPVYPNGLTQREVEVLRLVASGKTSAEIAAELVLSRRTVERHISNIYSKTRARSRAEATSYAFTHGLVSSS